MDSHIQMPKCILKQFVNNKNFLYSLDVNTMEIKKKFPKSVNTEEDYYSISIENFLSKFYESKIGKVIAFSKNNDFNVDRFEAPEGFRDTVIDYANMLIARGKSFQKEINDSSVFFQFMDKQSRHDFAILSVAENSKTIQPFEDHLVTFAINKSSIPFVLPTGGMCSFKSTYGSIILLPVTPNIAFALIKCNENFSFVENGVAKMLLFENDEIVMDVNRNAIIVEKSKDKGWIVSADKKILEELKATIS